VLAGKLRPFTLKPHAPPPPPLDPLDPPPPEDLPKAASPPLLPLAPLAHHHHHPGHPAPQLLAPTDDAFDQLRINLGGGRPLPKDALFRLDQLRNILLYHIVPGAYYSGEQLPGSCRTAGLHSAPGCRVLAAVCSARHHTPTAACRTRIHTCRLHSACATARPAACTQAGARRHT
jgi:hypothetical protein